MSLYFPLWKKEDVITWLRDVKSLINDVLTEKWYRGSTEEAYSPCAFCYMAEAAWFNTTIKMQKRCEICTCDPAICDKRETLEGLIANYPNIEDEDALVGDLPDVQRAISELFQQMQDECNDALSKMGYNC